MFELMIDFDKIRERAIDFIFDGAGKVSDLVETALDAVEDAVESLNDFGSGEKVVFDIETVDFQQAFRTK